jgi:hypothetical protein
MMSQQTCFSTITGMHLHLAYIDGGTGSMALQLLLAGALSASYAISVRWQALKKLIRKRTD